MEIGIDSSRQMTDSRRWSRKLSDRAKAFATSDESTHAKYAATILALDSSRPGAADDVVEVRARFAFEACDS